MGNKSIIILLMALCLACTGTSGVSGGEPYSQDSDGSKNESDDGDESGDGDDESDSGDESDDDGDFDSDDEKENDDGNDGEDADDGDDDTAGDAQDNEDVEDNGDGVNDGDSDQDTVDTPGTGNDDSPDDTEVSTESEDSSSQDNDTENETDNDTGEGDPGSDEPGSDDSGDDTPPSSTSGCGASSWPESGEKTIQAGGLNREYILTLPDNYDPDHPYELIFGWHGLTGTMQQTAGSGFGGWGYYGLQSLSDGSAIFIAGQGLPSEDGGTDYAWRNEDDVDMAYVQAILDTVRSSLCIDDNRIFSTGFSYGGVMSNLVGCAFGDVFRAIAPMAGAGPGGFWMDASRCVGNVAVWLAHGDEDPTVTLDNGVASRDYWIEQSNCSTTSAPTDPSPCVAYEGCDPDYPVHWCQFVGVHEIPDFSADAIWNFFSRF